MTDATGSPAAEKTSRPYTPDLPRLKQMATDAISASEQEREQAGRDRDYYDGPGQWTRAERAALRRRKQPDNYFNRVKGAVNGTLGVIKQGASDPKAFPRNPQDEDAADVASKTLRFIADANSFDSVKEEASKDYLIEGICAVIYEVDEDRQIVATQIRYDEFFRDARSRRRDFKDARYMGIAKWQYADDVAARYPDQRDAIMREVDTGTPITVDPTMQDRPLSKSGAMSWSDKGQRRILTIEMYHQDDGTWWKCVFFSGGVLEGAEVAYTDEKGRVCNPIEAQSCYVDRELNRYGVVRDMRGPQDEVNKRSSKLLHRTSTTAVQENAPGSLAGIDQEELRKEAARPDAVLPSGASYVPQLAQASIEIELLNRAEATIERMSPNPALLGRQGADQSGRAGLIRQQAGMTELAIVFSGLEDWEERGYRQMWNRARQYWTAPDYVRTTDDEGSPQFVGINQPQYGDPQLMTDPKTGQQSLQRPILGYTNRLAELDVDIIVDMVPDTANVQQEQFQALTEIAKVRPNDVTFDELVELSAMPNKKRFLEKRQARQLEQAKAQGGDPRVQQIQMAAAEADIEKTKAEAANKRADTAKTMVELQQTTMGPPPGQVPGVAQAGA